jgi:hypothetical protein
MQKNLPGIQCTVFWVLASVYSHAIITQHGKYTQYTKSSLVSLYGEHPPHSGFLWTTNLTFVPYSCLVQNVLKMESHSASFWWAASLT